MSRVNSRGYVERQTSGGCNGKKGRKIWREWYFIKAGSCSGIVSINRITFPKHLIGRKVRLKVEFMEDE